MKILITGSSGFIGYHLVNSILGAQKNTRVFGLDSIKPTPTNEIKDTRNYTFHQINLLHQHKVRHLLTQIQPDFVLHCAALTGVRESLEQPTAYMNTNALATQHLLENIKQVTPTTKIILFSSSSVYGQQRKAPFAETSDKNPVSPYGLSKSVMEDIAEYYATHYNLAIWVLRPFSVFGPKGRQNMAPLILLNRLMAGETFFQFGNDDSNQRDWTYISTVTKTVNKILENGQFELFNILNLGSGHPVGIETFIATFSKIASKYTQKKLRITKQPKPEIEMSLTYADTTKLHSFLGPIKLRTFEHGVEETVRWFFEERDCL